MAVIVKYVVVRDGKEDMIFTTKREAEAHDKMLDIAERLYEFLQTAELGMPEETLDNLTFFMAKQRDHIGKLLKGGKLETPDADAEQATAPKAAAEESPSSETKGREAAKRPRGTKPKAVA